MVFALTLEVFDRQLADATQSLIVGLARPAISNRLLIIVI